MEQNPASIIRDALEHHGKKIEFLSSEIAVFKQALCETLKKIDDSSNKMLWSSILYFLGSLLLTAVIAFSALVQAGILKI